MSGTDSDEMLWRGAAWPRKNRLDFGGDSGEDPDPRFLNPDQDMAPEFFYCPALIRLSVDFLVFPQLISECNSDRNIKIGPHLPKLSQKNCMGVLF